MKKLNILVAVMMMLMMFGLFAGNSFAAGEGMEHKTGPAAQAPMERETGRMEATVAAADKPFRASEVLGKNLKGDKDQKLGEVSDLIIGPEGEITFVLVSRGGLLGVGENYAAVPWSAVTRDAERDELFASITKESFDQAPAFSKDEIDNIARSDFEAKVHGYYGEETRREMKHEGFEHEGSRPMMDKSPGEEKDRL